MTALEISLLDFAMMMCTHHLAFVTAVMVIWGSTSHSMCFSSSLQR
jgi:hypothetical protein